MEHELELFRAIIAKVTNDSDLLINNSFINLVGLSSLSKDSFITQFNPDVEVTYELPRILFWGSTTPIGNSKYFTKISFKILSESFDLVNKMSNRLQELVYIPYTINNLVIKRLVMPNVKVSFAQLDNEDVEEGYDIVRKCYSRIPEAIIYHYAYTPII